MIYKTIAAGINKLIISSHGTAQATALYQYQSQYHVLVLIHRRSSDGGLRPRRGTSVPFLLGATKVVVHLGIELLHRLPWTRDPAGHSGPGPPALAAPTAAAPSPAAIIPPPGRSGSRLSALCAAAGAAAGTALPPSLRGYVPVDTRGGGLSGGISPPVGAAGPFACWSSRVVVVVVVDRLDPIKKGPRPTTGGLDGMNRTAGDQRERDGLSVGIRAVVLADRRKRILLTRIRDERGSFRAASAVVENVKFDNRPLASEQVLDSPTSQSNPHTKAQSPTKSSSSPSS